MKNLQPITILSLCLLASSIAFAEPANVELLKKEVTSYHDKGLYEKELQKTVTAAQQYIAEQVARNKESQHPQKLALVLDIDETSLSNYSNLIIRDFAANKQQIHKELALGNAPAIKPLLSLYQDAKRQGLSVFFVTGRQPDLEQATIENLKKAGYTQWTGLYFRPKDYSQASIIPYKTKARADITHKGYTIVASIGDQYSDIKGGYAQRGFKLPNPFYYIP